MFSQADSRGWVLSALVMNGGLAAVLIGLTLMTGSATLWAVAAHVAVTAMELVILAIAQRKAPRDAPTGNPSLRLGHPAIAGALVLGLLLLCMAGLLALQQAGSTFANPEFMHAPWLALGGLALALLLQSVLLLGCLWGVGYRAIWPCRWHALCSPAKQPAFWVLRQGLLAVPGQLLALLALVLSLWSEMPQYDALGGMGVGVLLLLAAGVRGVEIFYRLQPGATAADAEAGIALWLAQQPLLKAAELRVFPVGEGLWVLLRADSPTDTAEANAQEAARLKAEFPATIPEVQGIWIEFRDPPPPFTDTRAADEGTGGG